MLIVQIISHVYFVLRNFDPYLILYTQTENIFGEKKCLKNIGEVVSFSSWF